MWEVDADDVDGDLYSLEVDHSLEGQLPEFTVYASTTNPFGSAAAETLFTDEGVSVAYDDADEKWMIDFGSDITDTLISEGGITFYIVLEDEAGNSFGSMFHSGEENKDSYGDFLGDKNTFVYNLIRLYRIEGYKFVGEPQSYEDTASSDEQETLPDWEIKLYNNDDELVATTSTDTNGYYYFDVPAGDYEVYEVNMQMGWENDEMEVTKLQLFLNIFKDVYGGVENPVTGEFGEITDANVKRFQAHYSDEILTPWYERGIVPHDRPTGFVYKTTKWKINSMVCPDYAETPNYDGESLDENTALNSYSRCDTKLHFARKNDSLRESFFRALPVWSNW